PPRAQLTRLSPDRESGGQASRGQRHSHRDHGLRQGHRRALRRAPLRVQRFSPRQLGRAAVRRRVADVDAGAGPARAGERAGRAHHRSVAAALARGRQLEGRLLEPRQADARAGGRATPVVRRDQGGGPGQAGERMSKPFAGIRVLDFTRYLAGPYGTYQLGLLGADVVKIESRDGDETRSQLISKEWAERKMPPGFLAVNGNKRSITLDLRKPEAVEVVKPLLHTPHPASP